jgi:hypothetical protein
MMDIFIFAIFFREQIGSWVHWVKRHDMLAMATMYFYLATSVRLCLYPHGVGVELNRSARSMFRAGVCYGLGFCLKIYTKIDDEQSG